MLLSYFLWVRIIWLPLSSQLKSGFLLSVILKFVEVIVGAVEEPLDVTQQPFKSSLLSTPTKKYLLWFLSQTRLACCAALLILDRAVNSAWLECVILLL